MKLKCLPDDFQVEELTEVRPGTGSFALYCLEKRSLGTPEVVSAIAHRWRLPREAIAVGGLKDRHALTRQHATIASGPRRNLTQENFSLVYLGQVPQAFASSDISGNRFRIVLRDFSQEQEQLALAVLAQAAADGLPNYFDEQRFGSLGEAGEFAAVPWCQGNFEQFLWLALAAANRHDAPELRAAKGALREAWGNWQACGALARQESLAGFVRHMQLRPHDFRGAIVCVPHFQRVLFLSAFQSAVWNALLGKWLRQQKVAGRWGEVTIANDVLPVPLVIAAEKREPWERFSLPFPSARLHLEEGPLRELVHEVLGRWGLTLREMRVKYPRDSFFSKGERRISFRPANLQSETGPDELHPHRRKLCLAFELSRGSYATLLVRRLALALSSPLDPAALE